MRFNSPIALFAAVLRPAAVWSAAVSIEPVETRLPISFPAAAAARGVVLAPGTRL